jgi:hypothetical protein
MNFKQNKKFRIPQFGPVDWAALKAASDEAQKIRWSQCPPIKKDFYVEHPGKFFKAD